MVVLLVILTCAAFLVADYFWVRRRTRMVAARGEGDLASGGLAAPPPPKGWRGNGFRVPGGVFFAPGHTWVFLEETGTARLGVSDFAQAVVGDVERIESRAIGEEVRRGDVILKLVHGGRTASFRAPLDGVIDAVNADVLESGRFGENEPMTTSWVYKVRPRETSELPSSLLLGEPARQWLKRESERLKVFLSTISPDHPVLGTTLLDGGGVPAWGLIDSLSDVEWKKLQDKFFG